MHGRPHRVAPTGLCRNLRNICSFKNVDNCLKEYDSLGDGNSLSQLSLTAPSEMEPNALLAEEGGISQREMTGGVRALGVYLNEHKLMTHTCEL